MASTTKIMTCILALEYGHLDEEVTVSENAASQPKVRLGVKSGQRFYLRDLLYSLMPESHNDQRRDHCGACFRRSVESFAQLMNRKGRKHRASPDAFCDAKRAGRRGHRGRAFTLRRRIWRGHEVLYL